MKFELRRVKFEGVAVHSFHTSNFLLQTSKCLPCGNAPKMSSATEVEAEDQGLEPRSALTPAVFKRVISPAALAFILPLGRRPGLSSSRMSSFHKGDRSELNRHKLGSQPSS